jgi:hypothetical protein
MGKAKRGNGIMIIMVLSLFSFPTLLFADNGGEDLLKQAKQIFSPLPQMILSEKKSYHS